MAKVEILVDPAGVDWVELHAFLLREYAYMDKLIDPPSSLHRMSPDDFQQKARDETLVAAMIDGDLAGCLFCRRDSLWVYVGKVAVGSSHRGGGIARQMFEKAFELAHRAGKQGLELETRIELVENHQTFAKLGFVKVGENAHEGYDHPTSIRMRAELSST